MGWIIALVVVAVILLGLWLLQRFYAKATLETALVRTGFGGSRVVQDKGVFALPILHRLQKVSMQTFTVSASQTGQNAVLTQDKMRADVRMEFELRVIPEAGCIARAAQALGGRIARGGEAVSDVLSGSLTDAIQAAAATRRMDDIHLQRAAFLSDVANIVESRAERLGLEVVSSSLVSFDQSAVQQKDEINVFNATGARRLAELVAEQRQARVAAETGAEIAVRELRLAQHRRQLELQREEREAEISQQEHLSKLEAEAQFREELARDEARIATETAQVENEQRLKAARVESDQALRKAEMDAIRALEEEKIANDIKVAQKRTGEAEVKAQEEESRIKVILARENVQSRKEQAIAEREHEVARLRQEKELELEDAKVKQEIEILLARAEAEAAAMIRSGDAERARSEAEAAGRAALNQAENSLSEAVMRMRLEKHKLDRLPEIMTQMMKPVEKIDSIRINQISGIGEKSTEGKGVDGAFGAAMEQILGMAVRLPAMKQMGEEISLDFDANLAGRTADYANRIQSGKKREPTHSGEDNDPSGQDPTETEPNLNDH